MAYRQYDPSAAFRHLIDAYWINRPDAGAPYDRVLPAGCIDLVFRGGAGGGRLLSSALIERPVYFDDGKSGWFVGVRFRPAMAWAILDIEPAECRGRAIPAVAIDAGFGVLEAELQDCALPELALAVLKRAIDARLMRGDRDAVPARVREAIALLARGGDAAHVRKVALALGIAERSLHRDLKRWTGLAHAARPACAAHGLCRPGAYDTRAEGAGRLHAVGDRAQESSACPKSSRRRPRGSLSRVNS